MEHFKRSFKKMMVVMLIVGGAIFFGITAKPMTSFRASTWDESDSQRIPSLKVGNDVGYILVFTAGEEKSQEVSLDQSVLEEGSLVEVEWVFTSEEDKERIAIIPNENDSSRAEIKLLLHERFETRVEAWITITTKTGKKIPGMRSLYIYVDDMAQEASSTHPKIKVGDEISRVLIIRPGEEKEISVDHSLLEEGAKLEAKWIIESLEMEEKEKWISVVETGDTKATVKVLVPKVFTTLLPIQTRVIPKEGLTVYGVRSMRIVVVVDEEKFKITGPAIENGKLTLNINNKEEIPLGIAYDNLNLENFIGEDIWVRWESSDPDKVAVSDTGKLTVLPSAKDKDHVKIRANINTGDSYQAELDIVISEERDTSLSICYNSFEAVLTPGNDDSFVFLEVLKGKNADAKVSATYVYEVAGKNYVTVDLSFLNPSKPIYLRGYGSSDLEKKTEVVTVSPQPAKEKIKFDSGKILQIPDDPNDKTKMKEAMIKYYNESFGISDVLSYGYRCLYNNDGGELLDFDLDSAKMAGANIVIFKSPVEMGEGKDHPKGVEVKVKIPASPKAPKVTIDYVKGQIKLPKNCEYGILDKGQLYVAEDTKGGNKTIKEIIDAVVTGLKYDKDSTEKLKEDCLRKGFCLVVRTKGNGKKCASIPAFLSVKEISSIRDDGKGKVTKETSEVFRYEFASDGVTLTFSSGVVEYKDSGKWKRIVSGKKIKGQTTSLIVRLGGIKENKRNNIMGEFPSDEIEIKPVVTSQD